MEYWSTGLLGVLSMRSLSFLLRNFKEHSLSSPQTGTSELSIKYCIRQTGTKLKKKDLNNNTLFGDC